MSENDKYIVLDVVQVSQLQNGIVFTGKIKFSELNQVYKLTERKESIIDPIEDKKIRLTVKNNEFQRQLSKPKLKSIVDYLSNELEQRAEEKSLGMFPTSLILYNRSYEPDDLELEENETPNEGEEINLTKEIINRSYSSDLDCCFYLPTKNPNKLFIPRNSDITLIVDGQHRFVGTQLFYQAIEDLKQKEIVENFEFIVTYLVGFDIYDVGQIFATVNFNQKPVNRSLYYDIFGSAPQTDREGSLQNDIRLAHIIALHLNNSDKSPIQHMIKLLGKGYGLFSQAFFVDKMIRTVFKSRIWDEFIIDYLNDGNEYKIIAKFMRDYFAALHQAYPSAWPTKILRDEELVYSSYSYEYILCKTTGLGAYFRLIKYIYPLVAKDPENFKENILSLFKKISDQEAKALFVKSGSYGGAGSEGLQDKLFKDLYSRYGFA